MKAFIDRSLLLLCALVCASLSWAYFHFLQEHAFDVMSLALVLGLLFENWALRKQIAANKH